jgi:hypothetical protein
MASNKNLSQHKFALNNGSGEIPALGFGALLSDHTKTHSAIKMAVEVGFRHLDAAERYRNEAEVGAALKELFAAGTVRREDLFVTTIDLSASSPRSRPACTGLGSTLPICIWCTPRSRSSPVMIKIRATRMAL